MIKYIDHKTMGRSKLGWLDSHFHFSFAGYYNPENIQFGVLRVINDDLIQANTGFDTHPHRDMEIISYVVEGEITHQDSLGNKGVLQRGEVQYMSAGTGVFHSEHNYASDLLRLLQIWILPSETNLQPDYGDYKYPLGDRENQWLLIATNQANDQLDTHIHLHADVNIYVTILEKGRDISFPVYENRQAYMVLIEGGATINGINLVARDAVEIVESNVEIHAREDMDRDAHLLVIEMPKS